MEKINEQYASTIPRKRCKNFRSRKTLLGFLRCSFSKFSSLRACLLRLRDVMMHPRLIASDNVPRKIIPLCSISCQKSFAHGKNVCFLIFCQGARNPSRRNFSVTQIIWNDWLNTPIRYFDVCSNFPYFILQSSRIFFSLVLVPDQHTWVSFCAGSRRSEFFFVPVVDLGPWKRFFNELCS